MRTAAEVETLMNACERILHYADHTPQEPPAVIEPGPPASWPSSGSVEFSKYCMKYRDETPEVLHGISFTIKPGEKVGIVGRSGSGKSSILASVFRLIQDHLVSGDIRIDDLPIHKLGISQLRSKLSIIPQDPIMFSGSVRSNLDPMGIFASKGDGPLYDAIEAVGLKRAVEEKGGLDADVKVRPPCVSSSMAVA